MQGNRILTVMLMVWIKVSLGQDSGRQVSSATSDFKRNITNPSYNAALPYMCLKCGCQLQEPFWLINCSRAGFLLQPNNFPKTTLILDLSFNNFAYLRRSTLFGLVELRVLDLSYNNIRFLQKGSFDSLINLRYLKLSRNRLYPVQNNIPSGIFRSLTNLDTLWLNGNKGSGKYDAPLPDDIFTDLSSLRELYIDGFSNMVFGPGFANLTKLQYLIISGNVDHGSCNIRNLRAEAFTHVSNLKLLELTNCKLEYIHPDTFTSLKQLVILDVSYNVKLGFKNASAALQGLVGSDLEVLRMTSIHDPNRAGSELLEEDMVHIRNLNINEWHADSNGLEYIDYSVFGMFPKTLQHINLRKNRLHFGLFLSLLFDDRNANIISFDAGNQEIAVRSEERYDRLLDRKRVSRSAERERVSRSAERERVSRSAELERVSRSTERLNGSVMKLEKLICSGSRSDIYLLNFTAVENVLHYMDLSNNFIPQLKHNNFLGLSRLRYLNLSGNYIEFCQNTAFAGLDSLLTLDVQNNLLGLELNEDRQGLIFSSLRNLEYLDISKNRLHRLSVSAMSKLSKLKYMGLANNYIDTFDIDIKSLVSLKLLDLSNNRLQHMPDTVLSDLDLLTSINNLSVDLSRNMFLCNCETIPFLSWLRTTRVELLNRDEYQCSFNNGSLKYLNETSFLIDWLREDCASLVPLIAGVTAAGTFFSALVLCFVTYYNRWKLRYMYYMAKLKLDIGPNKRNNVQEFQYDVFVSYADEDRGFVINTMRTKLEDDVGLSMNIRDRDFELGEVNAINISKAVRMSKKTILVLGKPFLKNKWCDFEMNMARMEAIHMKRNVLILIFLEPIPANQLSLGILDLLRSSPNIEYPPEEAMRPVFWCTLVDKLREA